MGNRLWEKEEAENLQRDRDKLKELKNNKGRNLVKKYKVYLAGKITGLDNYKEKFQEAVDKLEKEGHTVMTSTVLPPGFTHEEYLHICLAMIDVCDIIYFLDNWEYSAGAKQEFDYGVDNKKILMFQ